MKGDMCHLLVSVSEALLLLLKAEAKSLDCCLIVVTSFFVSKKWFPPLLCFRVICLDSLMRSCVLAFSFLNLFFVVFSTWALQATASASNSTAFSSMLTPLSMLASGFGSVQNQICYQLFQYIVGGVMFMCSWRYPWHS